MRHNREEVVERAVREFERLERLMESVTEEDWGRPLLRPEGKDPWTVKDALAHITYWKAGVARSVRRQRRPAEERGLALNELNHLIYMRWRDRTPQEVLAWHRQVQADLVAALKEAPEEWFSGREHGADWPADLDGHSAYHRVKDIERALAAGTAGAFQQDGART
jgi:hypothetical protein